MAPLKYAYINIYIYIYIYLYICIYIKSLCDCWLSVKVAFSILGIQRRGYPLIVLHLASLIPYLWRHSKYLSQDFCHHKFLIKTLTKNRTLHTFNLTQGDPVLSLVNSTWHGIYGNLKSLMLRLCNDALPLKLYNTKPRQDSIWSSWDTFISTDALAVE